MLPGHMTRRTARYAFVAHFWSKRNIRQIKYIFGAVYVDFVRCDVTVISSLKRFKKSFSVHFIVIPTCNSVRLSYQIKGYLLTYLHICHPAQQSRTCVVFSLSHCSTSLFSSAARLFSSSTRFTSSS